MIFTKACFIRKNTPELRNKLKELGYEPSERVSNDNELCLATGMDKFTTIKNETFDSCNPHTTWNCAGRIDCNDNEELFLAIAAIRNDTDIYQWFISPQGFFVFNDSHKDISKLPPFKWRKATIEELIEYFKEDSVMKNQVLSVGQIQHLKKLGVNTSKASIYWVRRSHGSRINDSSKGNWFLSLQKEFMGVGFTAHEVIPTFTLQDIIDILPGSIDNNVLTIRKHVNGVSISYEDTYTRSILSIFEKEDIIEAAYEMLVWCVKNGYVKNK